MKSRNFYQVEVEQIEELGGLGERLQQAQAKGRFERENIYTGIKDLSIDYRSGSIKIRTAPAFAPFDPAVFEEFGSQYHLPLLSTTTHVYTGAHFTKPEEVLLQRRSMKSTAQGHGEIQPAAVGFVEFGESPSSAALREFREEGDFYVENGYSFVRLQDSNLALFNEDNAQCLDININNLLGKDRNPCLSYMIFIDLSKRDRIDRYRKVNIYENFVPTVNETKDDGSTEGVVLRSDYKIVKELLSKVWQSNEDFACTFPSFANFLDVFR